jgi:AsmA protein
VKPKLIASVQGQGGEAATSGIEVPVRITGSWDRPSYRADLKGVLANPGKTLEAVKELGKKFKGKNGDEIVDKIFGKSDDDPTGATERRRQKAKDLLNKFLGKEEN